MNDDEVIDRIRTALPGVREAPGDLSRIHRGIRRRRAFRWTGAGAITALVTAAAVTLALAATTGTTHKSDRIVPVTPQAENVFVDATSGGISLRSAATDQVTRVLVPDPPEMGTHDFYVGVTLGPSGRYVYAFRGTRTFGGNDDYFILQPADLDLVRIPVDGGPIEKLRSSALLAGQDVQYYPFHVYPSPDDRSVAVMVSTQTPTGHQTPPILAPTHPVLVVLSVPGGARRDMPTHDSVVGWLPDGHTLVTYNAPDPNKSPKDPNPPIVLRTLDVTTGMSKPLANLGVNPPIPTPACSSSVSMAVSSVTGEVAVAREAVHLSPSGPNCATNLPSTITVAYVEPGTGEARAGPTLPPAHLGIGDDIADDGGATYTHSGVLILRPRSFQCDKPPVFRIDGARVLTLQPGQPNC